MQAKKMRASPDRSPVWDGWLGPAPPPPIKRHELEAFDWGSTELGALDTWPAEVLHAIDSALFSIDVPVTLLLGPQLRYVPNDAYLKVVIPWRDKVVGQPLYSIFPEVRETLGPIFDTVLRNNVHYNQRDAQLFVECKNFREETYFDLNFVPIRLNTGVIVGVYAVVPPVTDRVVSQRRLTILETLSQRPLSANMMTTLVQQMSLLDAFAADFPFAVLYTVDHLHSHARRAYAIGTPQTLPDIVTLDDASDVYKIGSAALTAQIQTSAALHDGVASSQHPLYAHALPVRVPRNSAAKDGPLQQEVLAVLVVGHSPTVSIADEPYKALLRMLAARFTSVASISGTLALERQQYEEQRKQTEAKSEFFSRLSHEFRTTLTLMLAPLGELVEASDSDPDHERRYRLRLVHHNGGRMLRLVNNLLDFSLGESGFERVPKRAIVRDFAMHTAGLVQNFAFAAEAAGIRISTDGCMEPPRPVSVDLSMWEKIVYNLVSNAVKYTRRGGEVYVSLQSEGNNVMLSVKDTGIGIRPEHLDKVFDRYFRASTAQCSNIGNDHEIEGTGIGLPLTRDMVKALGGDIAVQSQLNVGSTFTVTVPLMASATTAAAAIEALVPAGSPSLAAGTQNAPIAPMSVSSAAPQARPAPEQPDGGGANAVILLVEDNEQMRGYVRLLLERAKYRVVEAENGVRALQFLKDQLPDLILSDVMMPEMNGFELVAAVRSDARVRNVPVILMSARGGEESKLSGLATTCDDYVLKPFSASELLSRVRTTIELVRQRASTVREREANELKNRFFAVVSHELRTPLTPVLLLAESIATDPSASDSVKQDAHLICHSMQLEMAMIDDLLDCAKLLRDRIELKIGVVDPLEVLSQTASLIRPLLAEKQQRLVTTHLTPAVSRVYADPVRLHQILWNLLKNAARFARIGGDIRVEMGDTHDSAKQYVTLRVIDSGPGVEASLLPDKLFELGTQGNTQRAGGLGIGLFLTKSLVERQGGTIAADNVEGGGARFTVTLPAAPADEPLQSAHSPMEGVTLTGAKSAVAPKANGGAVLAPSLAERKLRVLLVEDNTACRVVMTRLLEKKLNCEVHTAASIADAQQTIKKLGNVDLMLSDLGLPDGDGWELMASIRKMFPTLRSIALSGYGASEDMERSKQAGFSAHLVKPVRLSELSKAMEAVLQGRPWTYVSSSASH